MKGCTAHAPPLFPASNGRRTLTTIPTLRCTADPLHCLLACQKKTITLQEAIADAGNWRFNALHNNEEVANYLKADPRMAVHMGAFIEVCVWPTDAMP